MDSIVDSIDCLINKNYINYSDNYLLDNNLLDNNYLLDNNLLDNNLLDNNLLDNNLLDNDISDNDELNNDFENILNEINESLILYRRTILIKISFNCKQFIDEFPKEIFFKDQKDIVKYFLNNNFRYNSIIWIIYNQVYICSIINNIYFNDFLEFLFLKYKENINFYSIKDILNFILDSKYNFIDNILKCKKFYENIDIEYLNLNIYVKNGLENVD
jgi:hypothetical protein